MAWIPSRALLGNVLENRYNQTTPPVVANSYLILTNASTFTDASTVAALVQEEAVQANGYERKLYNPGTGAYDAGQSRYELPSTSVSFTPSGASLQYDRAVLLTDASATANEVFTADAGTDILTVTATTLVNGDKVVPTADAGGSLPTGITAQLYYAKKLTADTVELYEEVGLSTKVLFTDAGSGTLRLRHANGNFEFYESYATTTIPDGGTGTIQITINLGGNGTDVNAA